MNVKTAVLIICYKKIPYIAELAKCNKNCNFYIHVDLKSNIDDIKSDFAGEFSNVFWIEKRVDINWGGFSIVQAILNLLESSLANPENQHFHLLSGNCIFLDDVDVISHRMKCYSANTIFIELTHSARRRYRIRFNTPHADTKMQRSCLGRILTKGYQYLDKFIPVVSPILEKAPYGNMWFSANRGGLEHLYVSIKSEHIDYFRKKLVPDEHFFQYIILLNKLEKYVENYHRYINFIGSANHPEMLDIKELLQLDKEKYWVARKVNDVVALDYLHKIKVDNVK